jgi:hypothetical protein
MPCGQRWPKLNDGLFAAMQQIYLRGLMLKAAVEHFQAAQWPQTSKNGAKS